MSRAWQHRSLRAEALLEDVADRVERGVVAARDDELGERRRRQLVEGYRRLVGRTLRDRGPRACLDRGREGVAQFQRRPDEREEELEYPRGSFGAPASKWARNSSTAGSPRATPKAGGSTTVSDASGARAAASSETTAP